MLSTILMAVLFLAPLAGALVNGLRQSRASALSAGAIASLACFTSFLCAVGLFFLLGREVSAFSVSFFEWINLLSLKAQFSFLVDPLSVLMLLVITGVGFLIHLFSIYYMSHDARPAKYFSYLNLFIFSMMILVMADNLLLMFLGWEGVGFCSYLLIGFWFTDRHKSACGMKAFIVNRIGDMGFVLGMFLLLREFSGLDFLILQEQVKAGGVELLNVGAIKWACLFLFMGAVGKSAQIPLYMWLPSAMAGPTPVSALIHAATMVTAGVYLIVRLNFLFVLAPEVLTLIAYTGALTAFLSALIACAQTDIKKVLAYSTVSQLGYMFIALGVGAFTAGVFHLVTHAFFKALLFLSAGAVIHALNGEQNIHRMGGLKKHLPLTRFCFLMGFLALIGLPPFSGFFSKDEILWSVFVSGKWEVFALSAVTALITVFYMTRLFVLVFGGQRRFTPKANPGEGGVWSNLPLVVLAFLSVIGGVLGIPHLIGEYLPFHPPHWIEVYLKPVLAPGAGAPKGSLTAEAVLMLLSAIGAGLVLALTRRCYLYKGSWLLSLRQKNRAVCESLEKALGVDAFCDRRVVRPVLNTAHDLWRGMDVKVIQGFIVLVQEGVLAIKSLFEKAQSGNTQHYLLFMVVGIIVCAGAFLIR